MSKLFRIHPDDPQLRLVRQAAEVVQRGGVIIYPTDSSYALGCALGHKNALTRICQIRQLDETHNFTLICRDLSEISNYAMVSNAAFRYMKSYTPGPYTFVLPATKDVPRRLQNPKRKTIGLRVPDDPVTLALLGELDEPMMTTTLVMPGDDTPMIDPEEIYEQLHKRVDLIIDSGYCGFELTTVIDLVSGTPKLLRQGKGQIMLLH